ncbi:hypothetical protein RND81_06G125200 [Saponaria officinalis]|uniref:Secreted protein n=1 Tax=Saponaria officinalis TaxID=3572 RepID=A0AAW1KAG4_SAPOF
MFFRVVFLRWVCSVSLDVLSCDAVTPALCAMGLLREFGIWSFLLFMRWVCSMSLNVLSCLEDNDFCRRYT